MRNSTQSDIRKAGGFGAKEFERYVIAGALRGIEADMHIAALLRDAGLISPAVRNEYARRIRLCMHRNFAGALANAVQAAGDHNLEKIIPDLADMHHAVEERVMTAADFAQVVALHGRKRYILDTYDAMKLRAGAGDGPGGMRTYREAEEGLAGLTDTMRRDLAATRATLLRHMPDFFHDVRYDTAVRQVTDRLGEGRYAEAFDLSNDAGSREFFSALSAADDLYRNKALTEEEHITVVRTHNPYLTVHRIRDPQRRVCLENRFRALRAMRADLATDSLTARDYEIFCGGMRHVGAANMTDTPSETADIAVSLRKHFNKHAVA